MSRIPFPTAEDLPPEHQGLFDRIARDRGGVSDLFRVLAYSPDVLLRRMAFGQSLRKSTILDPRLRELAILTVARLNGGGFEFSAHEQIGLQAGISQSKIAALADFEMSPAFDERERAVMRYAEEVTRRIKVPDEVWAGIAAFLNNRELVELVLNVAWYNQTARVTFPLKLHEG